MSEWERELAVMGARMRLQQIDEERERILGSFPELAGRPRRINAKAADARVIYEAPEPAPERHINGAKRKSGRVPDEERQRARFSPEKKAEAKRIRLEDPDRPVTDIGEAIGISPSAIHRYFKEEGLARPPGGSPAGRLVGHANKVSAKGLAALRASAAKAREALAAKRSRNGRGNGHQGKRYEPQFMADAVARLANEYLIDVARDLNISDNALKGWAEEAGVKPKKMPEAELAKRNTEARNKDAEERVVLPTLRLAKQSKGTVTAKEVAKEFDLNVSGAQYRIRKLKSRGLLADFGTGEYKLTDAALDLIRAHAE